MRVAIETLVEDCGAILNKGLRPEDAMDRAQLSTATFYRHHPTKEAFIKAVMDELIPANFKLPYDLSAQIESVLMAKGGDPRHAMREVANWDFREVCRDHMTARQILALVLGRKYPTTMKNLQALYRSVDDQGAKAYEMMFERWGASIRKPFDVRLLSVSLVAIVEGLAFRWKVNNDDVPDWLFGEIAVAFMSSVIDTQHKHEHIDDVAASIAADIMANFKSAQGIDLPSDPRQSIIDTARIEFGRRGYFATTLEMVAAGSGVPLHTVKNLFSSKPMLIVGALQNQFFKLSQAAVDDITLGLDEMKAIERHLERLAKLARDESEFIDALLMALSHETYGNVDGPAVVKEWLNFPKVIVPAIEQGLERGTLSSSQAAYDIAAVLTNMLLMQTITHRSREPEQHVQLVSELVLRGLSARPDSRQEPSPT
ncbi:TetR/AcrR family transcriptional regulator [Crossiella sp. SN42]|uniref:TetR/AcrR family transcriptional regulator n=1 Tax=Crossiella sp. SN42 TaxID=2944808 RepID=UPI00207C30F8|nr:TetR/AcrR family transcriptional regulator [Crossiella sp. SN42]MCO1578070.1 TetR/AcrR family transcriptional regulator [Crossiella sp. SN42]